MPLSNMLRSRLGLLIGSPEFDRLSNYITQEWVDLDRSVHIGGPQLLSAPWARSAQTLLLKAQTHLEHWEFEGGWAAAMAARRAILSNPGDLEPVKRAAVALRREVDKITGWRAKAIKDLICNGDGGLAAISGPEEAMRVVEAIALRDDFSQNEWFKIVLRIRHLTILFLILWSTVIAFLALSRLDILPAFLADTREVGMVILFGVLGAAVSVAQSLVSRGISERIPIQQIGAIVVWTRPGIGAAAALVVFALLNANSHFKILGEYTTEPAVIAVFSFLAGYSERFIIGALERLSDTVAG